MANTRLAPPKLRPLGVASSAAAGKRPPILTETSWSPRCELTLGDWTRQGRCLGSVSRATGWWIGDWIRYGNARYGEKYETAASATGYDIQSLMNMAYVASRLENLRAPGDALLQPPCRARRPSTGRTRALARPRRSRRAPVTPATLVRDKYHTSGPERAPPSEELTARNGHSLHARDGVPRHGDRSTSARLRGPLPEQRPTRKDLVIQWTP
jgi:hypothetical protein